MVPVDQMIFPKRLIGAGATIVIVAIVLASSTYVGARPDDALTRGHPKAGELTCEAPCPQTAYTAEGRVREPHVVVDPANPNHIVVGVQEQPITGNLAFEERWLLSIVSFDAGSSWTSHRLPGGPTEDADHPLFSMTRMTDPVVTILPDGTVAYAGLAYGSLPPPVAYRATALFVALSFDGGLTYPEVTIVEQGVGVFAPLGLPVSRGTITVVGAMPDRPWIHATPQGKLLLAWSRLENPDPDDPARVQRWMAMQFSWSVDRGRTWTAPVELATAGLLAFTYVAATDDGTWHASFIDSIASETVSEDAIFLATSHDMGSSWSVRRMPFNTTLEYAFAVDSADGSLAFISAPQADDGRVTLYLHRSTDGGHSWSNPLAIDVRESAGSMPPTLLALPGGTLLTTFYHPRPDDPHRFDHVALAVDPREGTSRLTLESEITDAIADELSPVLGDARWQLGDYFGLSRSGDRAFAVWTGGEAGEHVSGAWLHVACPGPGPDDRSGQRRACPF